MFIAALDLPLLVAITRLHEQKEKVLLIAFNPAENETSCKEMKRGPNSIPYYLDGLKTFDNLDS